MRKMIKPIAPMMAMPIPVILALVKYSSLLGFLVILSTRMVSLKNLFKRPGLAGSTGASSIFETVN